MESLTEAQLARLAILLNKEDNKPQPHTEVCEVTACIPTWDALCWEFGSLAETLHALRPGAQSIPLKLVLCDNGSRDGTQVLLRLMAEAAGPLDPDQVVRQFWLERFRDIKVAVSVPQNEEYAPGQRRMNYHMKQLHPRMLELVDTPYVVSIDSDVKPPRRCLRIMLDCLKENPDVGLVGVGYPPHSEHIQHGLAMMDTEFKRSLPWDDMNLDILKSCTCRWMNEQVKIRGKKTLWLDPLSAGHTKMERG